MTYRMKNTVDPDGKITEWETLAEWPAEDGGTYTVSRPKGQDQDEPANPPATQTRTLAWTGYRLTVRELRSWIDQLPNDAHIYSMGMGDMGGELKAAWEVP